MLAPGIPRDALVQVLCQVGRVERLSDLGSNGPLLASAGSDSLFHCVFGRDALRMAHDLIDDFPAVARATLLELAKFQGVRVDNRSEEEPGRILHELRTPDDPHVEWLRHLGWDFPYYGSVDATPQWVSLLGAYVERYGTDFLDAPLTDRTFHVVTLRASLERALAWIVERLESPAAGGFLWVRRANPNGIANQVWQDSYDAYFLDDGTLLDPELPYAPIAVQGYAFDALLVGAQLLGQSRGEAAFSPEWLRARAQRLRAQLLEKFWQADLRTFAVAVAFDARGFARPARVVGSEPGHLLASRVLDADDVASPRESLIGRLFEDDLLGSAGIRTKSTTAARFSPGSYHNGSIWPMDNGVIADGLRRHNALAAATDLEERILAACRATGGFPEFVRGDVGTSIVINNVVVDSLADGQMRRLEQPPQLNQGWTATRVWRILRQRNCLSLA